MTDPVVTATGLELTVSNPPPADTILYELTAKDKDGVVVDPLDGSKPGQPVTQKEAVFTLTNCAVKSIKVRYLKDANVERNMPALISYQRE